MTAVRERNSKFPLFGLNVSILSSNENKKVCFRTAKYALFAKLQFFMANVKVDICLLHII